MTKKQTKDSKAHVLSAVLATRVTKKEKQKFIKNAGDKKRSEADLLRILVEDFNSGKIKIDY